MSNKTEMGVEQTTDDRPTGRELRLVNAAVDLVNLLDTGFDAGFGIVLSDSAKWRLRELREATLAYVGKPMRQIPLRVMQQ